MLSSDINHRPVKSWTKLTVEIDKQLSSIMAAFLASISDSGVEFQSDFTPETIKHTEAISIYLDKQAQTKQRLEEVHQFLAALKKKYPACKPAVLNSEIIFEEDWGSSWKKHFKPVEVTNRLTIKPSWESYSPKKGQFVIDIDPGMAFGTGLHASTQLSLQLIDALYSAGGKGPASTLDVGTGTGILGMSCALLGSSSVIGIDNDIDARVAAAANLQRNNLSLAMTIVDLDLADIQGKFELVIANIIHNTLIELSEALTAKVADQGFLILAGILSGKQIANITKKYCSMGFEIIKVLQKDEWSATCLRNM